MVTYCVIRSIRVHISSQSGWSLYIRFKNTSTVTHSFYLRLQYFCVNYYWWCPLSWYYGIYFTFEWKGLVISCRLLALPSLRGLVFFFFSVQANAKTHLYNIVIKLFYYLWLQVWGWHQTLSSRIIRTWQVRKMTKDNITEGDTKLYAHALNSAVTLGFQRWYLDQQEKFCLKTAHW